jgi:hypothetical protein
MSALFFCFRGFANVGAIILEMTLSLLIFWNERFPTTGVIQASMFLCGKAAKPVMRGANEKGYDRG